MLTLKQMQGAVDEVSYKNGWEFDVTRDKGGRAYLQATCHNAVDSQTGEDTFWRTAKYYLSKHMCRQEIIGAVFKCVRDAEEHEMREWFRYRGSSIYSPHLDPDALADLASRKSSFVFRENAMSMDEVDDLLT